MIAPALAHDLTALGATMTALTAHCGRRHAGHTRQVLCALRVAHDHQDAALTDDDRRTLAMYYRTRREYWRGLPTTDDLSDADDGAAREVRAMWPALAVHVEAGR